MSKIATRICEDADHFTHLNLVYAPLVPIKPQNPTTHHSTHPLSPHHSPTYLESNQIKSAFRAAGELGGKIVAENAKPGTLCGMALDIFAGAYGAEAGVAGQCCLRNAIYACLCVLCVCVPTSSCSFLPPR